MTSCPACRGRLTALAGPRAGLLACAPCGSAYLPAETLAEATARGAHFHPFAERAAKACPACGGARSTRQLVQAAESWMGSHCSACGLFEVELSRLGKRQPRPESSAAERAAERAVRERTSQPREVAERERVFAFLFGIPLELSTRVKGWPPATGLLFWIIVALSLLGLTVEPFAAAFVLQLHDPTPWTAVQLLTAVFLHADLLHLAGNLYFLIAFGRLPEAAIGPGRFVALFLASGLVGNLFYLVHDFGEELVVLGASGAVAGILGAYFVLFPAHRVGLSLLVAVVRIPAFLYLFLWAYLQLLLVDSEATEGVAYAGHLLGFATGVCFALGVRGRVRTWLAQSELSAGN